MKITVRSILPLLPQISCEVLLLWYTNGAAIGMHSIDLFVLRINLGRLTTRAALAVYKIKDFELYQLWHRL